MPAATSADPDPEQESAGRLEPPAAYRAPEGRRTGDSVSLRKEVIQPQVLLRLPCYDFTPIMNHTVSRCPPKVSSRISSTIHFRDVTGGVYKARERIHRSNADLRLLATPASCRRVSACNPN